MDNDALASSTDFNGSNQRSKCIKNRVNKKRKQPSLGSTSAENKKKIV